MAIPMRQPSNVLPFPRKSQSGNSLSSRTTSCPIIDGDGDVKYHLRLPKRFFDQSRREKIHPVASLNPKGSHLIPEGKVVSLPI
jgi:hypothetical protein